MCTDRFTIISNILRTSGVTDHYALNDHHALDLTREMFKTSFNGDSLGDHCEHFHEPLYPAEELYGIVGTDLKKSYDVKEVRSCLFFDAFDFVKFIYYIFLYIIDISVSKKS